MPARRSLAARLGADRWSRARGETDKPYLLRVWQHRLTEPGRMLMVVVVVAGSVAVSIGITYPLYHFALFVFVLLAAGRMMALGVRPRGRIERRLPERCAVGATVSVHARVTNVGRLPAFDLAITERVPSGYVEREAVPPLIPMLGRGESIELSYPLQFTRRGAYDFPGPQALTAFPFGLFYTARHLAAPHRLLVYPRFHPLGTIALPTGATHQPGGLALVSQVGDSEEFIGNREYRPGDRLRDLDQRAWARVGRPIVREYQQEYLTRIALVLDTYLGPGAGAEALEAAISLGAAVTDILSRQEYVVDVFAAGPDLYHFQAGRSLAYLDRVLDILATIEANPESPFATLTPALMAQIAQISTAVVVLLDWDSTRLAFVRELETRGVAVKLVVVRDAPPSLDPTGMVDATLLTPAQVEAGGVERL